MTIPSDMFAELGYDPQIKAAAEKARTAIDAYIDERVTKLKDRHTANCQAAATEVVEDLNREAGALASRLKKTHDDVITGLASLRTAIGDGGTGLNDIQAKLTDAIKAHEDAVKAQQEKISGWAHSAGKLVRAAVLRV